ncbi:APC family permease [Wohlfahrtiimonas larvae]|uniref:APC family permease n=2 Tax=Wohlfahrtiimonas larvae TaxID=1157986 RepID=A0ABP9MUV5_9GAMM|nr:APC family permease [Wohlfahrtiimonas larvae]
MNKKISSMDVLFLAMGAMLGWGWVILSGDWVATAGFMGATLAFAGGGLLIICIGLTYAELATAIPETGGGVAFVQRAYNNKPLSFLAGWSVLFGYMSVIAFEAVALPTVIDYVTPIQHHVRLWNIAGSEIYLTWALIGSLGAIFLGALNYRGIRSATIFQTVFTVAIVAVGVLLIFGAGYYGESENLKPYFNGGFDGMMKVLIMVPFMFVGFDVIPQIASEIKATKSIGKMLVISILSALIFYVLIIYGVSIGLPHAELQTSKLATADAMTNLFDSKLLGQVLVIGGIAGIVTSWNAFVIGGSRIMYAMAIRGMLPNWFAKLHPKYQTPSNAIIFLTALAFLAPLLGRQALVWLVNAGSIGVVLGYLIVTLAFLQLRKTEPNLERPYAVKWPKTIGWLAVLFSIGFLSLYFPGMPAELSFPIEWSLVFGWYMIGAYFLFIHKNTAPTVDYNSVRLETE